MVERIELIERIERIESVESIESIDTFDSIEISSLPHSARSITAASRDGVAPPVLARFCGSCPTQCGADIPVCAQAAHE
jgi:hypothetical protein